MAAGFFDEDLGHPTQTTKLRCVLETGIGLEGFSSLGRKVPIGTRRVHFDNEQPPTRHFAQNIDAQECDIGERGVRALGERYNFSIVIQRERATMVGGGHG